MKKTISRGIIIGFVFSTLVLWIQYVIIDLGEYYKENPGHEWYDMSHSIAGMLVVYGTILVIITQLSKGLFQAVKWIIKNSEWFNEKEQ